MRRFRIAFVGVYSIFFLSSILFSSGCSTSYKHTLDFNPSEPIRVAVLPFAQLDEKGEIVDEDGSLLIDNVSVISSKGKDSPRTLMRKLVQNELSKTSLDLIPLSVIDSALVHSGFGKSGAQSREKSAELFPIDLRRMFETPPAEVCTLLSCDAVLYGKVTDWDRGYYGIQSSINIGLDIKLISARDGNVLFQSQAKDYETRGITKGPTGFSDLVIEPIKGLDSKIIEDLAKSTVSKMISPLLVQNRPDYLKTPPPAIFGAAHDSSTGRLSGKEPLTVVMFATPDRSASFSVGNVIRNVPMLEIDSGHYVGEFHPLPTDRFENERLLVFLSDSFGRTTELSIESPELTLIPGKS